MHFLGGVLGVQPLHDQGDILELRRGSPDDQRIGPQVRLDCDDVRPGITATSGTLEHVLQGLRQLLRPSHLQREDVKLLDERGRLVQQSQQIHDDLMVVARGATDQAVGGFVGHDVDWRSCTLVTALFTLVEGLLHLLRQHSRSRMFKRINLKHRRPLHALSLDPLDQVGAAFQAVRRAGHEQAVAAFVSHDAGWADQVRLGGVVFDLIEEFLEHVRQLDGIAGAQGEDSRIVLEERSVFGVHQLDQVVDDRQVGLAGTCDQGVGTRVSHHGDLLPLLSQRAIDPLAWVVNAILKQFLNLFSDGGCLGILQHVEFDHAFDVRHGVEGFDQLLHLLEVLL